VADAYAVAYAGRNHAKLARVEWWASKLGDIRVVDLDADEIADLLDAYADEPLMRYRGRDEDGRPVLKTFGARKAATVNRTKSTLGSIIQFTKDRRLRCGSGCDSGALDHAACCGSGSRQTERPKV
jgi:hypothetical protein